MRIKDITVETASNAKHIELARSRFSEGFSCSQSVLAAFAPELGLDADAALRVSAAFGGGMGRTGGPCGAVTGALMVLGLKYGATVADPVGKRAHLRIDPGIHREVRGASRRHDMC